MENDVDLIEKARTRGIVTFDLAKSMFKNGVPQASQQWYSQHIINQNILIHFDYHGVKKYHLGTRKDKRELVEVFHVYPAFSAWDIHEMLMPVWKRISLPVPFFELSNWRWINEKYNIKEKTQAEATGKYLLSLLEHQVITLKELYVNYEKRH